MTTTSLARNRASLEYLTVQVTADVTLDTQPVAIALMPTNTQPGDDDWMTATWLGAAATVRKAQALLPAGKTPGVYIPFVRVTDNPEIPVLKLDPFTIT